MGEIDGITRRKENPLMYMRSRVFDNFNIGYGRGLMRRAVTSSMAQALLRVNGLYKNISKEGIISDQLFERFEKLADKLYVIPVEGSIKRGRYRVVSVQKMDDIIHFLMRVIIHEIPIIHHRDFGDDYMIKPLNYLFYFRAFRGKNLLFDSAGNQVAHFIRGANSLVTSLNKIDVANITDGYRRGKRMTDTDDYDRAAYNYVKMYSKDFMEKSSFDTIARIVRCRDFDAVLNCMKKVKGKIKISDLGKGTKDDLFLLLLTDNYYNHLYQTFHHEKEGIDNNFHQNKGLILLQNIHAGKLRRVFLDMRMYMKVQRNVSLFSMHGEKLKDISKLKMIDILRDHYILSYFTHDNSKIIYEISSDFDRAKFAYDYIGSHKVRKDFYDGICSKVLEAQMVTREDVVDVLMHYIFDDPKRSSDINGTEHIENNVINMPENTQPSTKKSPLGTKVINLTQTLEGQSDHLASFSSNSLEVLTNKPVINNVVSQQQTSVYNFNNMLLLGIIPIAFGVFTLIVLLIYKFYDRCSCKRRNHDRSDNEEYEEYPLSRMFSDNITSISNDIKRP